jgi:type II secretory pathway component GspD/PulD (secretin)
LIDGNNLTIIIKQIGDSNVTDNSYHLSFKGTNMTLDYTATGDSNKLRFDIDDVDATGFYLDHDITGDSNIVDYDTWANDSKNFNVDLDIYGDSNTFWVRNKGDNHFLYVRMSGDSNDVQWYSTADSEGFNTNANKAIGPQTASHSQFADSSGSEGAN